jgi:membrane-associated phospholipid phosphatase
MEFQMTALRNLMLAFVLTAAGVAVVYFWLDRPLAFFAHEHLRQFAVFDRLTRIPELIGPIAVLTLLAVGVRALMGRPLSHLQTTMAVCGVSLIVSGAAKTHLKYVFGRTWPETWVRNNPSLIRDGVYGFNPFHDGAGFASFPSGHTAAVCAMVAVLWLCYPSYRWLYGMVVAAVTIGLVAANYHFLSDVIAGGFLGSVIGYVSIAVWRMGARCRVVLPPERNASPGAEPSPESATR